MSKFILPSESKFIIPLDDDAILSDAEVAQAMRISEATLRRRRKAGKAPARTQLSDRLFGTRAGSVREHLRQNTETRS